MVEIGEVRKWQYDNNNDCFKIQEYRSFFLGEHYYIIEYLSDNRKQTVTKGELLVSTILCNE